MPKEPKNIESVVEGSFFCLGLIAIAHFAQEENKMKWAEHCKW